MYSDTWVMPTSYVSAGSCGPAESDVGRILRALEEGDDLGRSMVTAPLAEAMGTVRRALVV